MGKQELEKGRGLKERREGGRRREGGKGPTRQERGVAQCPLQSDSVLLAPGFGSRKNLQR